LKGEGAPVLMRMGKFRFYADLQSNAPIFKLDHPLALKFLNA
jgi:hypothetical protein